TRYLRRKPLFVTAFLDLGLKLNIDHPRQLGADLIAAAVATRERYGIPAVMVDFGTATTVAALDGQGAFVGASIAPGLEISLEALRRGAPHLPDFPLDSPPGPLGRNTVHCLQSGVLLGHALMVDGLVRLIQAEVGPGTVVATGGLAEVVARHCSTVHSVDANLVLDGIRLVWERNAP
ncbi:MAG TPA: type III pantothenate kinase, partial [Candidatus Nitrosotenuis sp.]|nr:type III pantothenate kinase [Candidatus Nitrosotenuis sp.]